MTRTPLAACQPLFSAVPLRISFDPHGSTGIYCEPQQDRWKHLSNSAEDNRYYETDQAYEAGPNQNPLSIHLHAENHAAGERKADWAGAPGASSVRTGQFALVKAAEWATGWQESGRKGFRNEDDWRLRGRTMAGLGWGHPEKCSPTGSETGVPPSASPQLTEHEHGTMAHHGGAMRSPVPRAGGTGRSFWRENLREAQKTLPPQGLHLNPLSSGSPPISAPTSLTGTKISQLVLLAPPPTQERQGKLDRESTRMETALAQ